MALWRVYSKIHQKPSAAAAAATTTKRKQLDDVPFTHTSFFLFLTGKDCVGKNI
jgi:hypothetical protein